MKRRPKKLALHRETLQSLGMVQAGNPPSIHGSDCEACITIVDPGTGALCTGGCGTGAWSNCASYCPISCNGFGC